MLQVRIPEGMGPGSKMIVQAPGGQRMQIVIPPGVSAGQTIQVAAPAEQGGKPTPERESPPRNQTPPPAPPTVDLRHAAERASKARHASQNASQSGDPSGALRKSSAAKSSAAKSSAAKSSAAKSPAASDPVFEDALDTLMTRIESEGLFDPLQRPTRSAARNALKKASGHVGRALNQLKMGAKAAAPSGSSVLSSVLSPPTARAPPPPPPPRLSGGDGPALVTLGLSGRDDAYGLAPRERVVGVAPDELPSHEWQALSSVLELLDTDGTSNAKLRTLTESSTHLPRRLTRAQAAALLRCFSAPLRRVQALELLQERLQAQDVDWAGRFERATIAELRLLCGEA